MKQSLTTLLPARLCAVLLGLALAGAAVAAPPGGIGTQPQPPQTAGTWQARVKYLAPGTAPEALYRGRGCRECRNIGYSGRIAVYEVFGIDAEVRRMVIDGIDADAIRRRAAGAGMMTLRQAGFRRVVRGDTTLEEVLSVVADQE